MKSILKSTAILSSSSLVSILVGLFSAKFWAVLLGPIGLGYMGLLQGLVGLSGLVAGMGIGTGMIRMGSSALASENYQYMAALRQAAWLLFCILGGTITLLFFLFQNQIANLMLGSPEHANNVVLMIIALLFTVAASLQTSLLNAYHRVSTLAKIGVLNSIFGTSLSLLIVWSWGKEGIALAIIAGAIVSWIVSRCFMAEAIQHPHSQLTNKQVLAAARALLRFGAPYTASMLVGTGVQLVLPVIVLHILSQESVGFYRAALTISVSYLGFLINAMSQDYYPRVSAASEKPALLNTLINHQQRLVLLIAVPMILGVLALAPYIVPIIYSPQFSPAIEILEWQLIGDLFKFSSWTVAYVILARMGSTTYFITELIGGIVTLLATWIAIQLYGLDGLGIGFFITYLVYYLVTWLIVRRDIKLVWTNENKKLMLAALFAGFIVRILPSIGPEYVRTLIALLLALAATALSVLAIGREIGGWRNVPTLLRGISK
jgi:PST family polysaccharide transporter